MIYAEGEDERVLRAVQVVVDEKARAARSSSAVRRSSRCASSSFGLRIQPGRDFEIVNPEQRPALS